MPGLFDVPQLGGSGCRAVAAALPALVDGSVPDPHLQAHLDRCLRCQAEVVQYRKLSRALNGLREVVTDPGPGLVVDVLAALAVAAETGHHSTSVRRVAYLGGVAVATAAGAIVWASRRRAGVVG